MEISPSMAPSALYYQPPVLKPTFYSSALQPALASLPSGRGPRWAPRAPPCTTLLSPLRSRSKEDMLPAALSPEAQLASSSGGGKGGGGKSGERSVSAEGPTPLIPVPPTPIPWRQEAANEQPRMWVCLLPTSSLQSPPLVSARVCY